MHGQHGFTFRGRLIIIVIPAPFAIRGITAVPSISVMALTAGMTVATVVPMIISIPVRPAIPGMVPVL